MQGLIETLGVIRNLIDTHTALLSHNETLVRYALINPLLGELNWDMSNPDEVMPEVKNFTRGKVADYDMGNGTMIIEAKKLYTNLEEMSPELIISMNERGARYSVLTDGQRWIMYDKKAKNNDPVMDVDITDSNEDVLPKLMHLHKSVVLSKTRSKRKTKDWVSLQRILPSKLNPPTKIKKGNQPTKIKKWIDVYVYVAKWLINEKHIRQTNCPLPSGTKNYLVHTTNTHPNGTKFSSPEKIQEFYIEKKMNADRVIQNTLKLIKMVSPESTDFEVYADEKKLSKYHNQPKSL